MDVERKDVTFSAEDILEDYEDQLLGLMNTEKINGNFSEMFQKVLHLDYKPDIYKICDITIGNEHDFLSELNDAESTIQVNIDMTEEEIIPIPMNKKSAELLPIYWETSNTVHINANQKDLPNIKKKEKQTLSTIYLAQINKSSVSSFHQNPGDIQWHMSYSVDTNDLVNEKQVNIEMMGHYSSPVTIGDPQISIYNTENSSLMQEKSGELPELWTTSSNVIIDMKNEPKKKSVDTGEHVSSFALNMRRELPTVPEVQSVVL